MEVMGKSSEVCHGNPSYHPSKRLGKKVNNKTLLRGKMGVNTLPESNIAMENPPF